MSDPRRLAGLTATLVLSGELELHLRVVPHAEQRYAVGIAAELWGRDSSTGDWKSTGASWYLPVDVRPGADTSRERALAEQLSEEILANRTPGARLVLEPRGAALAVTEAVVRAAG